jgi:hypothetical protein
MKQHVYVTLAVQTDQVLTGNVGALGAVCFHLLAVRRQAGTCAFGGFGMQSGAGR